MSATTEELKAYLQKGSPESRKLLATISAGMSPKQQQGFLAALQLGDTEFQAAVAPYMPPGSEIDPSSARLKAFPEEANVPPQGLNLKGVSSRGGTTPLIKTYKEYEVEIEPNTVTAVEAVNANPRVWGHEFRHFEGSDGGSEIDNRFIDLMASQSLQDLTESVRSISNRLRHSGDTERGHLIYGRKWSRRDRPAPPESRYADIHNRAVGGTEEDVLGAAQDLIDDLTFRHHADVGDAGGWRVVEGRPTIESLTEMPTSLYVERNLDIPSMYRRHAEESGWTDSLIGLAKDVGDRAKNTYTDYTEGQADLSEVDYSGADLSYWPPTQESEWQDRPDASIETLRERYPVETPPDTVEMPEGYREGGRVRLI